MCAYCLSISMTAGGLKAACWNVRPEVNCLARGGVRFHHDRIGPWTLVTHSKYRSNSNPQVGNDGQGQLPLVLDLVNVQFPSVKVYVAEG